MVNSPLNKLVGKKEIHEVETRKRSLVKTILYRVIILIADFVFLYAITGKFIIALGFMVISNLYTSVSYYFYDRAWDRISWGKILVRGSKKR